MADTAKDTTTNENGSGIALMHFPKQVLSRLQPDLVLQRHLQLNLRPKTLMKFTEFRDVSTTSSNELLVNQSSGTDGQVNYDDDRAGDDLIISNNLLKVGGMFIKTELSLGITRVDTVNIAEDSFAPIWPEVIVDRGRIGAPTDEEMIASRQLFESIIAGKYIRQKDLIIKNIGKKESDSETITYDSEKDDLLLENEDKWCFVLYAKINVYSREGPIYDHVFNSVMYALEKLRLPGVYIEESSIDLQLPAKKSFNKKQKQETQKTFNLKFDFDSCKNLVLNNEISISSNFGVVYKDPTMNLALAGENGLENEDAMDVEKEENDFKKEPVLLADISTDIEENSIYSRLSISCNSKNYTSIKLINGSNNQKLTVQQLKTALQLSKSRHEHLVSKGSQ